MYNDILETKTLQEYFMKRMERLWTFYLDDSWWIYSPLVLSLWSWGVKESFHRWKLILLVMNYIPLKYIREMKSFVGLRDFFLHLEVQGE